MDNISLTKLNLDSEAFNKAAEDIANLLSVEIKEYLQNSIKDSGAVGTGDLLNSISSSVLGSGTGNLLLSVGSTDPAAVAIEEGLPPGSLVNQSDIRRWMVSKGLDANNPALVKSIINKIYKEGTSPKSPFMKAFNSPAIDGIINSIIDTVLSKVEWAE